MLVALIAHDKPGALETRKANREAHLEYVAETGLVAQAGPLLDSDGQMCGSLVILNVDSMEDAHHWAAGDPYAAAELFKSTTLVEWKKVIG